MMNDPAWVVRMEKATDKNGYHCSGFEANAIAKEWREQQIIIDRLQQERDEAEKHVKRLQEWINDLHSGMYINCVYCGHRYGPSKDTPVAMAEILERHIEQCPKHPLSKVKADCRMLAAFLISDRGYGELFWKSPFISYGSEIHRIIREYEEIND